MALPENPLNFKRFTLQPSKSTPLPTQHCEFVGEPAFLDADKARICTKSKTSCFTYGNMDAVEKCITRIFWKKGDVEWATKKKY